MPYTAGDFSPSVLGDTIIKEMDMLNGQGRTLSELSKPIVAGQAILMNQDPSITEMYSGQDCISAKIVALRGGSVVVAGSSTLACDIPDGNELGSEGKTLDKVLLVNPVFASIKEKECNNAFTWEERLAYVKLKAKVELEVALTKKLVSNASLWADIPSALWFDKTAGTVVGNSYDVTNANFKPELYADILYASNIIDMNNPIVLNGINFYHDTFLTQFKGIACCDNDTVLTGAPYQVYFDLRNVDTTIGAKTTFAIDKNAMLFWSSPIFNAVPREMTNDTIAWTEELPRLRYMANGQMLPIYVDIRAQKKCVDNGTDIQWNYEFTLRGALDQNLLDYNNRGGILKITRVA